MALKIDDATNEVYDFLDRYNNNIELKQVIIGDKQEDIYGQSKSYQNLGFRIYGAYDPANRSLAIPAGNYGEKDIGELQKTIKHELLGHYGINTLNREEKHTLLNNIIQSKDNPSLKEAWDYANENYPQSPESHKAEEVFAYIAENISSKELSAISPVDSKAITKQNTPVDQQKVKDLITDISSEIERGTR